MGKTKPKAKLEILYRRCRKCKGRGLNREAARCGVCWGASYVRVRP